MSQNRLAELMTGEAHEATVMAEDRSAAPVVVEVEGPDPARRVQRHRLRPAPRRGPGHHRTVGRRPHRAGDDPFRPAPTRCAAASELDGKPLRLALQPRRHRRRHRLRLRGPPVARPRPAAVDRRATSRSPCSTGCCRRSACSTRPRERRLVDDWIDRLKIKIGGRSDAVRRCPAATSSGSCSPSGWPPSRAC